jgi:hypothetical protein
MLDEPIVPAPVAELKERTGHDYVTQHVCEIRMGEEA